jgi:methyltransferase (TIGR04290 family)
MTNKHVAFFGSSLTSAYWNGAATYYRGLLRALAERGHVITFYEPDAFDRQAHRDLDDPDWARVVVYPPTEAAAARCLDEAAGADLLVKASGIGVLDVFLEAAVLSLRGPQTTVAFWDVDAPATLERVTADPSDPFIPLIPGYDLVFTYGGGPPVVAAYEQLGARACVPIYNAADPETHHPTAGDPRFAGTLGFLGNRLPDREARVHEFFFGPTAQLREHRFVLGGNGWQPDPERPNVAVLGHIYTHEHNAFNSSPLAVLNVNRSSMARFGFSPATRVFEAAAAGACIVSDAWPGLELFLEPGRELLVANDGSEVAELIRSLTPARARTIGTLARTRVLAEHTYRHRADDVERALGWSSSPARSSRRSPSKPEAKPMRMVFVGLSITSSWGNGHATTYRALVRALCGEGHDVLFLERDVPWYAAKRDMPRPPYGRTELYASLDELRDRFGREIAEADVVLVGSYVPDGIEVGEWVTETARGVTCFYDIDTPVTLATLATGTCEYISRELLSRYNLYLSFTGGPTLPRLEAMGAARARALYCSVDPELYQPQQLEPRWQLGYMGTYSDDRQGGLTRLLIEPARALAGPFVVAGANYPESIAWPANVERIEHLPPGEHATFYNRMRFTLNVTRAAMIAAGYSPSVRLFEAAACAVPIISDVWPGIEELFEPNAEIVLARSSEDVIAALRDMPDEARVAMGERARARVLAAHTGAHRAAQLCAYVREASPTTRAPARGRPTRPHGRALLRRIEQLGPWFHNLELDGISTAPEHFLGDYPRCKLQSFVHGLPDDLEGASVLDIGCNAGFYTFELKRRNAGRVLAIDSNEHYLAQARLAAEVLDVRDIEFRNLSVYDVATLRERFDVVLFMGVLYHLRHPLLALDLLHEHVVGDRLLFQSMLRGSKAIAALAPDYPFEHTAVFETPGYPCMSFVEHCYAGDPSNWWIPNRACVEAMLRSAGFSIEWRLSDDVYWCRA